MEMFVIVVQYSMVYWMCVSVGVVLKCNDSCIVMLVFFFVGVEGICSMGERGRGREERKMKTRKKNQTARPPPPPQTTIIQGRCAARGGSGANNV
jgi:hypothetical protein